MRIAFVISAALAIATPAAGQDTDGWDAESRPGVQIAGAAFSSGTALIFQCQDARLDAIVTGLPPGTGRHRTLEVSRPDGQFEPQSWRAANTPTAAFSMDAARLARASRLGGVLSIRAPAEGDQPSRLYRMELPSQPAALDTVLTSCGISLVEESDSIQPPHTRPENLITWRTLPAVEYPERAAMRGIESGRVELNCAATLEGDIRDCRIVSEEPQNAGFGAAARSGAERARLEIGPGRTEDGRIQFPIEFRLGNIPPSRPRAGQ